MVFRFLCSFEVPDIEWRGLYWIFKIFKLLINTLKFVVSVVLFLDDFTTKSSLNFSVIEVCIDCIDVYCHSCNGLWALVQSTENCNLCIAYKSAVVRLASFRSSYSIDIQNFLFVLQLSTWVWYIWTSYIYCTVKKTEEVNIPNPDQEKLNSIREKYKKARELSEGRNNANENRLRITNF